MPQPYTSALLKFGDIYSRPRLAELFDITDATLKNGVFQPKGTRSVWLFVTEDKTPDRTQYRDLLQGDTLYWQGQTQGRTDSLIIEHESRGLEILLFYRQSKLQHPQAGFRYEGPFRYLSHSGAKPTSFILVRQDTRKPEILREDQSIYDPARNEDAREKVLAEVVRRQGQSSFRAALMAAYGGRCAITGCAVTQVLEAAHIHPYSGPNSNHVSNGLLLRADLHTLFDLGLISIDAQYLVHVSPFLLDPGYANLAGQKLRLPAERLNYPSQAALEWHRQSVSGLKG